MSLDNSDDVNEAVLATSLHPYFKLRWLNINKTWDASEKKEIIQHKIVAAAQSHVLNIAETEDTHSSGSEADDYFEFDKSSSTSQKVDTLDMKVLSYLNDSEHTLESFQKHSLMKSLFFRYNTALPSSAPVERLFSLAGITLSPKRNKLSDSSFERLVLLKCNKQHN